MDILCAGVRKKSGLKRTNYGNKMERGDAVANKKVTGNVTPKIV